MTKAIEMFAKYLSDVDDDAKKPIFHVDTNGDFASGDGVGGIGVGGEHYIYVAVRIFFTIVSPFSSILAHNLNLTCIYWHIY